MKITIPNYPTLSPEALVPFGPGASKLSGSDMWLPTDVAMQLEDLDATPGGTRAILSLTSHDERNRDYSPSIAIELTEGDAKRIIDELSTIIIKQKIARGEL